MTFVIEDGEGREDAESYASVATADDHIEKWHSPTLSAWFDLTGAEKEAKLRRGTRFVDSHRFLGERTDQDQALAWPRIHVGYVDGQRVASDDMPAAIVEATIEAALREAQGASLLPDHDGGTVTRTSTRVGPIATETAFAAPRRAGKTFEAIRALLRPYTLSGSSRPLTRAFG